MPQQTLIAQMYNEDIKLSYLKRYENVDTKEVYGRIFKKSAQLEQQLKKDLYDFNEEELRLFVMQILQPKTKESSRSIYSTISSYLEWSISENYSHHIVNPWKKRGQDYIYGLVMHVKNYMSYDEKQYILSKLINAQDKFIIEALWNGVQGDKLIELVTLMMNHVNDESNTIVLMNENKEKIREVIAFDGQLCNYAIQANAQRLYIKKNGQCSENTISESAELVESNYIIKRSNTKHKGDKSFTTHYTVYNRIEMFRELRDMDVFSNVLVTKNIVRSGMIYHALLLYKRDGVLGREQIEEICNRFNVKFKWSMKDFLNIDHLNKLYPEEVKELATV
ncbi:phage lytic cycle repressor MrpR family protein [Paenibacillus endoradicis]|uniref:phage lytic cycle repressor MrpR family protein n=1 Tax=Paenibacillus endoradicis TaxID=2972487 RepID=UPI0021594A63|nr:hypothetical protein [Paenibacillus endoradicis]MCR8657621.1 hypothetical protein [Paenibacillus endoradicis]